MSENYKNLDYLEVGQQQLNLHVEDDLVNLNLIDYRHEVTE